MMPAQLVLSLFPGIGLLDAAFEAEGFCVVRGPDLLWGGDVRRFHPPAGRFDGVIGGPPCQAHSQLAVMARRSGQVAEDLIPEFVRVIEEARPCWFVMENVPGAHSPDPGGYAVVDRLLDNHWLGETAQGRLRRFWFGVDHSPYQVKWVPCACCDEYFCTLHFRHAFECGCPSLDSNPGDFEILTPALVPCEREPAVIASGGGAPNKKGIRDRCDARAIASSATLQGLPEAFLSDAPFTLKAKQEVIGNGVPLPMGRAVARAVKKALGVEVR